MLLKQFLCLCIVTAIRIENENPYRWMIQFAQDALSNSHKFNRIYIAQKLYILLMYVCCTHTHTTYYYANAINTPVVPLLHNSNHVTATARQIQIKFDPCAN